MSDPIPQEPRSFASGKDKKPDYGNVPEKAIHAPAHEAALVMAHYFGEKDNENMRKIHILTARMIRSARRAPGTTPAPSPR